MVADGGPHGAEGTSTSSTAAPGRRPTIFQVAERAGVSHQTVSRYLRGNSGMKPATAAAVRAAVEALGYRPDVIARSMRTGRSHRVAIVLPELSHGAPVAMLRGAVAVAHEAGYRTDVIGMEGDEHERRERLADLIDTTRPEGILSFVPLHGLGPTPAVLGDVPVVVSEEFDDQMRSRGATATAEAAGDVVDHLADLGHRHLLHVSGPPEFSSARNRRDVFLSAAARRGLPTPTVHQGDWSITCGYEAVLALPEDTPVTAVFAANDFTALGVLRGLQSRGWRVPEDASVVGWDDESFAPWSAPPLSTVRVDREALGAEAMASLMVSLGCPERAGRGREPGQGLLRLVTRTSSGIVPGRRHPLVTAAWLPERERERIPDAVRVPHR